MDDYERGYRTQFRSYGDGDRRLEIVSGKVYSANHPQPSYTTQHRSRDSPLPLPPVVRNPKGSSSFGCGLWGIGDPEMKRKGRVASYKAYGVEGKVRTSLRKSVRWVKAKCSLLVHGF